MQFQPRQRLNQPQHDTYNSYDHNNDYYHDQPPTRQQTHRLNPLQDYNSHHTQIKHDTNDKALYKNKDPKKNIFNLGGVKGNIIGSDQQTIRLNNLEESSYKGFGEEDLDQEMDCIFGPDEPFDPILEDVNRARQIAESYLQLIKMKFPNRYFILKKIAQDPIHWEACLQKNYVIITDNNYTRKLQNCFEVIGLIYQISDNVYLVFMSVDNKEFLGYARVNSNIQHISEIPALSSVYAIQNQAEDSGYAFKIKWISKNSVSFDYIRFIRNSHNSNNSINMCKEFNEVDEFAAKLLLEILSDPESAPEPSYNPFSPVGVLENWTENSFHDNIKEGIDIDQETVDQYEKDGKGLGLKDMAYESDKNSNINFLSNLKGVNNLLQIIPGDRIPENFNKYLVEKIQTKISTRSLII